jgi:hypothetical protein
MYALNIHIYARIHQEHSPAIIQFGIDAAFVCVCGKLGEKKSMHMHTHQKTNKTTTTHSQNDYVKVCVDTHTHTLTRDMQNMRSTHTITQNCSSRWGFDNDLWSAKFSSVMYHTGKNMRLTRPMQ